MDTGTGLVGLALASAFIVGGLVGFFAGALVAIMGRTSRWEETHLHDYIHIVEDDL